MKAFSKILITLALLTITCSSIDAQYYSSRKHNQGKDTLYVYNSWQSLFFDGPDTLAINPNIEVYSPFKFKFKPTEKDNKPLKKMIEKQSLVVSIGDSVWFINKHYLKDSLDGQYNDIFEDYVPLYFNEKILIVQYIPTSISYLYTEIDNLTGVFAGVGEEGIFYSENYGPVAIPLFVIDLPSKRINLVDTDYLLFLLSRYPDMKRRYEMMADQDELYMINEFFWDYVHRISSDPTVPELTIP